MASPRYKGSLRKKLNSELDVVVSSLKKENAYLKKSLVELSRQHSEHNRMVERFLFLETVRLESCQQLTPKDEKALPAEPLSENEGKQMDVALEKNKQWLEYDQQREAYGRATLARMLWLEQQLNEANQARSQQHNEGHSDEVEKIGQMQEHYERLLKKAKDELEVLREKFNMTDQKLKKTQNWCMERERDVEEFKHRLQTERMSKTSALGDYHCSEDEEQWLSAETENLQCRLDEERRKSANIVRQSSLFQTFLLNCHQADQDKIADLERQIKISSQDLEDEKQNCSYLKKQMVRVLRRLQKPKDHVAIQSKRDQQDCASCEEASCEEASCEACEAASCEAASCEAASLGPRSPASSVLNESFLECPSCKAKYQASHYRELMSHLEICLD